MVRYIHFSLGGRLLTTSWKKSVNSFVVVPNRNIPKERLMNYQTIFQSPGNEVRTYFTFFPSSSSSSTDVSEIKSMKTSDIKNELESYGISTDGYLEKNDLVEALTKAREEGLKPKSSSSTTTNRSSSSTSTDSTRNESISSSTTVDSGSQGCADEASGPQKKQQEPSVSGDPFGGLWGMEGMKDKLKNLGLGDDDMADSMRKAQKIMSNQKVREIMVKAQSNPRLMAIMNEVKSDPAALMKYQNDPEVAEFFTEVQKYS